MRRGDFKGAFLKMRIRKIEYSNGKTPLIGYLAHDEQRSGRLPGVVVFPEAFGLNEHARVRAERLAQLGYVALAADPHGDGQVFPDLASVSPRIGALYADRAEWRARAQAAYDALLAQPEVDPARTAAIGFCFGGSTCFELVRTGAPLAAIVTFHAGLVPEVPGDAGRIRAKVLVCHGAEDPLAKKEAMDAVIAELKRDRVDWQLINYGNTVHSFTDPDADQRNSPAFAYNRLVEQRSWTAMRGLFDEVFG
jgi:dienelactone hydrolase